MTRYILQSLKLKTSGVGSKELSTSGKSWVKAQYGTRYQVIDEATGLPPKKLRLRKKDKNLIVENDGETLVTIRGFYADTHAEAAARYRVDDSCSLEESQSLAKQPVSAQHDLIGGTGKGAVSADASGNVWSWESGVCAPDSPQASADRGVSQPDIFEPAQAQSAAADAGEGLSRTQMIGLGLGALLIGGGAAAAGSGGGGGGGGGSGGSASGSAPAAPKGGIALASDTGVVGDGITSDTTPTIAGTGGTPGNVITVIMPGTGEVLTAIVAADGTWSITPTQAVPDGTTGNIAITATDSSGRVSAQTLIPLTIITDLVVQGTVTGGPMYAGIGLEARDSAGNLLASSSINADGTYHMQVDRSGSYRGAIMVTAVDNNATAGNYLDEVTGVSKSLGVNLRGLGVADSGSSGFNILGNGNTQLTVNISILSELAVRQVLGNNTWPLNPGATLTDIVTANKNIANAFGIGSDIDITTVVPTATNAAGFNAADGISNAERVGLVLAKLSGLDALNGGNVAVSLEQLTATLSGNALTSAGLALVDQGRAQALLALKANATTFNDGGTDSDINTILNRQLLGEAVITGQTVLPDGKLSVQGTALPGSTVTITWPDGTQGTATANANGVFTLESGVAQPNLTQPLEVRSQDALSQPVVYDPPAAPVIAANNGHIITGSGTPGSTVTVMNGAVEVGTAIVDALGHWSIVPVDATIIASLLATPVPTLTATAKDANGNVSSPAQKSVDLSGIASRITEAADGYVNASEKAGGVAIDIYLPVTAAANDAVSTTVTLPNGTTITLGPTTLLAADIAAGKLTQTILEANLGADGTYTTLSTISRGGMLTASAPEQRFVLDTVAPAAPVVNDTNGLSINGTAEPGSIVKVMAGSTVDGTVVGTVVGTVGPVGADGNWTLIAAAPLANGTAIIAQATDAAGNEGSPSNSVNVNTSALIVTGAVDNVSSHQGLLSDGAQTDDTAPLVTGTLGAELASGQQLNVYRDGVKIGVAIVNGTAWRFADSDLTYANYAYTVQIANADNSLVGSASRPFNLTIVDPNATPSAPFSILLDTVAPTGQTGGLEHTVNSDTGKSLTDSITANTMPVLTGTAEANSAVEVTINSKTYITTASATGAWSVDLSTQIAVGQGVPTALPDGTHTPSIKVTDLAGNSSTINGTPLTVDTTAPTASSSLTVPENANNGVNSAETVSGAGVPVVISWTGTNAVAGDVITLTVDDPSSNTPVKISYTISATDVSNHSASVLIPTANIPLDGVYNLSAIITDVAGNSSAAVTGSFTADLTAPSGQTGGLVHDSTHDTGISTTDNITANQTPTLTGSAEAGSTVSVTVGGTTYQATLSGTTWTLPLTTALTDGTYTPAITVTDAAGNSSTVNGTPFTVDHTVPNAPSAAPDMTDATDTGSSQIDNITHIDKPDFNVGVLPSDVQTVRLLVNDSVVNAIVSQDANGNTILTPVNALSGSLAIKYEYVDFAGNVSQPSPGLSVTIDTTAPTAPSAPAVATSSNSGSTADTVTNDNTPEITGSGTDGDLITLKDATGNVIGTAVVSGGVWSITPTLPLPEGAQTLKVNATDPAGNTSTETSLPITIDTIAPTSTGVLTTDTTGTLAGGLVGTTSDRITRDTTPAFSGTGQAGNVITLELANATYTTTVAANGTWSIDTGGSATYTSATFITGSALDLALPNNNANVDNATKFDVRITQTDVAGNANTLVLPITIDTIVTDPTINITNGISPITGTGEAGAKVVLYQSASLATDKSGLSITGPDGSGNYAFSYTLSSTPWVANHILTTSKPRDVVITSTQPETGSTGTVVSGTITAAAYNAKETNPIVLYDSVQVGGVATVDASGQWSISFGSVLTNGTFLTVNSVDLAGNIDPPGVRIVSVDQNTPLVNATNGLTTVTGTGSPTSEITIYKMEGSTQFSLGKATVDANGQWTLPLSSPLPNGTVVKAVGQTGISSNQVTVDNVAPNTPTVSLDPSSDTGKLGDNLTTDTTPTLTGIAEAFSTVTIKNAAGSVVATAVADSTGKWSATTSVLPAGDNTLSVIATDLSGNKSITPANISIALDSSTPAAPASLAMASASDTGSSNTDQVTSNTKPTITGSGTDGDTITLKDAAGNVLGTAVVANGSWSITPSRPLADGAQSLYATATNPAGTTGPAASVSVTIDTLAPDTPNIDSVSDNVSGGIYNANVINGGVTNDSTPTITGTAVPNSTVSIYDGATLLGTTTSDGSGNWTFTAPSLADGIHSLKATTSDTAGNASAPTATFALTVDTTAASLPTVSLPEGDRINAAEVTSGGGTPIVITLPENARVGDVVTTVVTKPNGQGDLTLSYTILASDLPVIQGGTATGNGPFTVSQLVTTANLNVQGEWMTSTTITDVAGNTTSAVTSGFVLDTVAPSVSITAVADDVQPTISNALAAGSVTNDSQPTLTLTAEAGSTVRVYDGGTLLGTATESSTTPGSFTFSPLNPLSDGTHSLTATATDAAGNTTTTTAFSLTVDASAPSQPSVSFPEGSNGVSAAEAASSGGTPIVVALPTDAKVGDVITTVVTKPDGTTAVTLSYTLQAADLPPSQGGTKSGAAPFTVTQTIASDYLTQDGAWSTSTSITDTSGNVSAPVVGTFTLDKTAPDAPLITAAADNVTGGAVGALASGDVTNDNTPTLSGTAEAGSTVTIKDGSTVLGSVIADSNGNWTYTTPTLTTQGTHSFTATATDVAGNTGSASTAFTLKLDTVATSAPGTLVVAENTNGGVNASEVLSGGGIPVSIPLVTTGGTPVAVGDTVSLVVTRPGGATTTINTILTSTGTLEVLVPASFITAEGTYTLSASITDAAGNVSSASAGSFLVDTIAPNAPTGGLKHDATNDTGISATDNLTNLDKPTLSGTAEANAAISVVVNGATYTTTADGNGNWSANVTTALLSGTYTPIITATDTAGNSTTANGTPFTVDLIVPIRPTIVSVNDNVDGGVVGNLVNGALTNDTTPTLSGTAEAGSRVDVYDGATKIATVTADASGNWTYIPASAIASGAHSFTVKATDAAGNTTDASDAFSIDLATAIATPTLALAVDTGSSNSDGTTSNGKINVSGLVAGAAWQYSLDNGSTWLTGTGSIINLPAGTYTAGSVQVKQSDAAGNTSAVGSNTGSIIVDTSVAAPTMTLHADTGSASGDGITNDAIMNVGNLESGATWQYAMNGGGWVDGTGTSFALSAGSTYAVGSVQVRQIDAAGNVSSVTSNTQPLTIDTAGPTVTAFGPADNGIGAPADNLTVTFSEPVVKGTGTIRLVNDTDKTYVDIPVTDASVTLSGNKVTINPASDMLMGKNYHVEIPAGAFTDVAGNAYAGTGDSTTWNFTVPNPAISLNSIAGDNIINAAEKTGNIALGGTLSSISQTIVQGFVANNITVKIYDGATLVTTVTAASYNTTTGAWTASVASSSLADGKNYTVSVHAAATIGSNSYTAESSGKVLVDITVATPTITLAADTGSSAADYITNNGVLNIGNLEAGATWQYSLDNGVTWQTGSGTTLALSAGTYNASYIKVRQTDLAGNTSAIQSTSAAITVDATAPSAPIGGLQHDATNDTGTNNTDNITKLATPMLTGTAEANAAISVTVAGSTYTTTANASGVWSVSIGSALPSGTYTPVITATDKAGNATTVNGTPFTVDTIAPAAATGGLADSSDSGVKGDNRTNDTTPDLTGTAEPGATVKVTVVNTTYTTTANSDGVWSLTATTALANSGTAYTPSIQVIDKAGNTTTSSGTPFYVDTAAPSNGTAALASASDTGTTGDNKTNDSTPVLSGNAEAGATVELTVNGNIYRTIAGSDGKWSLDLGTAIPVAVTGTGAVPTAPVALSDGSYTPTIKVTDTAGNSNTTVNGTAFTVDTAKPVVTLTQATINNTANAVVKSTEPGTVYLVKSTVAVTDLASIINSSDNLWNSVAVSANTNTNLAATGLVDGTYKAYAVDAAGNLSLVSTDSVLIDTSPPKVTGISISSATGIQNSRLNVGDVVYVTMTTSEPVTATGSPKVLLNVGGSLAAGATTPSGGTNVWAALVSGNGTNQLVYSYTVTANLTDTNGISIYPSTNNWLDGTYTDAAGNVINKATAYAAVTDNPNYLVDTTVATPVLSLAADTGANTSDRVTSNPIINVTGIEAGATWQYSTNGGSTWTNGTGTSFTAPQGTYTANSIQVKQTDLAGNEATGKYAYACTIDSAGPTVSSVAITSATKIQNGTLNRGDVVSITVTMSEATTVTTTNGTPQLALNIDGKLVYAEYFSGTGTSALVFKYAVGNDLTDIDGISIDANSLTTNGGILVDASGNNAVLTHTAVADNNGYKVDTTGPTIAITRNGSGVVGPAGETITFTLSEASTDFIESDITVTGGTLSNFSGSGTTYTALFKPSDNSTTTATINVLNEKFTDAAGNANRDTYQSIGAGIYETNNTISLPVNTSSIYTTVSFSSMTKDTSPTTAHANWEGIDGSAGRLLSGTLNAVLTEGQTVQVYSNGNLIGAATVNGKAWEITDLNGYSADWIYTAKVVGPTGVSGTVASRTVILDTIEAAPVITAVRNANNEVLPDGSATTVALASVKGTGVAGNTIYLYDNTGTNLVGTTTVASDGTWIITGLATNSAIHSTSNSFAALQVDGRGNQSVLSNLWRVTAAGTNQIVNGDFAKDAATATVADVGFTVGTGVTFQQDINFTSTGTNAAITTWMPADAATTNNSTGTTSNTNISWFKTYSSGGNPDGAMSGNTLAINVAGGTTGRLWQNSNISVEAGKTYLFKFDYSANFNGGGNIGLDIDGVTIAVNSLSSESGHYTVKYVATATKNITLNLWGNNTYTTNTSYYGDIAVDNLTFFELATPSGNTLVAGNPVLATSGDDNLNYAAGLLSTLAGNDTINAVNTSLQTTLVSGAYINAGAGVDTLVLAAGTTLDLTALTNNQTVKTIQEVEVFQMQGNSKLTLSANDVLSLGGANLSGYSFASTTGGLGTTTSTGKVQMVIEGLAGDKLDLKPLATDGVTTNALLGNTGLAGEWLFMGATTINTSTYKVYNHSTTGAQVLVASAVDVNSRSLGFTSMTKDSSTSTATADWTTADGSAGRLVSGMLLSPLPPGSVIKIHVNGVYSGDATVNDAGTAWSYTDTGAHGANWTYRADIVVDGAVSDTISQSVVLDASVAAPVIAGVKDSANAAVANAGSTLNKLASVSGTGEAGATIYLYDNSKANLVGTATVASDGTWNVSSLVNVGAGNNSFSAIQVDALGNQSVQSNLWSVTAGNTNLAPNGDFTSGVTGFATGLSRYASGNANISDGTYCIWYNTNSYYDVDDTFATYGYTGFATDKTGSGAATDANNGTTKIGNQTGSAGTLTWVSDYGNTYDAAVSVQYSNPDAAMTGNALIANMKNTDGYGRIWQNSLTVVAGQKYTLTFDYVHNGAFPLVFFGDTYAEFDTSSYEFGHLTATFTAGQSGTILYGIAIHGSGTGAAGTCGDVAIDNIKLVLNTLANDGSLVAGAPLTGATMNADVLTYTTGMLDALADNDTIVATNNALQTTLATAGNRINGGAGVDTLKLASGTTLDLTAITGNQTVKSIQEVEAIQMQGGSKLTLNANDVLSLGGANLSGYSFSTTSGGSASASSTGKVQMVITGLASDQLVLSNLAQDGVTQNAIQGNTGLAGSWLFMGNTAINGVTYRVYNSTTTNAQVLTTVDATTQSDNLAFTSMTKDTATGIATGTTIGTDTANANWATADLTAGRLVSGTLATPLAAGQTIKVYSDVNGVATLIGTAVVNAAGTAWEITDRTAYTGNWAYTADVVDASNKVVSSATRAVIALDALQPPPEIKSVTDNAAASIVDAGKTANMLSTVSGTGEAGATIYLYDNSKTNLVGTTTVASDGTWTVVCPVGKVGVGTNVFSAVQADAIGNQSVQSNLWSVTVSDAQLLVNGDFTQDSLTGFTAPGVTWLDARDAFANTTNAGISAANYANAATTTVASGTTSGIAWSNKYVGSLGNPDGAFTGNLLIANIASKTSSTFWETTVNVETGKTYQFKFDYLTNIAYNGSFGITVDGVNITVTSASIPNESGHFTATYTATSSKPVTLSVWGINGYGSANYGDVWIDNMSFAPPKVPANDSTLAAGVSLISGATLNADNMTYTSGVLETLSGNDVITASASTLFTTLTTGGGRINGGAGLDTLKLANSTTLDLTNASITLNQTVKPIQEVEIFTLQGSSTLTLSANDVLSLGAADVFAINGKVQLMVNGTSSDTVTLKNLLTDAITANGVVGNTDLAGYWTKVGRQTYNSLSYDIYDHSTTGAEVWVQTTARVAPLVSISRSGSGTMLGAETITFKLSQATTNFIQSDVKVSGGALSNWTSVGVQADGSEIYTATFTPTANSAGNASISVGNSAYASTANSMYNADGADPDNAIATPFDTIAPTVAISQTIIDRTQSLLTFTLNRASSDFDQADVTLNTGELTNWTHVGLDATGKDIYTATYTYTAGAYKELSIASGKFTDALGRANADGADANNKLAFSDVVTSQGAVIYGGTYTGYPPIRLEPATTIGAGEMVTSLKMSLDYYSTAGDGLSMAFGKGPYRWGYQEYGMVNGVGATIDTLSGTFGGSWADIFQNDYVAGSSYQTGVQKTPYSLIGDHHADFEVTTEGYATLRIDGVQVVAQQISNWTTMSQAGWYFQIGGRTGADGGYFEVSNINFSYNKVATGSPLALDLNGDGVQTIAADQGIDFDLQTTGTAQHVGWIDSHDGILALDLNSDGLINTGSELFGDHTLLADGSAAADGWQALAQYDGNLDGLIDQQDAVFEKLKVWVDANTNGQTDAAELKTLNELGIVSIDLHADDQAVAQNGNILRGFSTFATADGQTHQVADAWLAVQQVVQTQEQLKNAAQILPA